MNQIANNLIPIGKRKARLNQPVLEKKKTAQNTNKSNNLNKENNHKQIKSLRNAKKNYTLQDFKNLEKELDRLSEEIKDKKIEIMKELRTKFLEKANLDFLIEELEEERPKTREKEEEMMIQEAKANGNIQAKRKILLTAEKTEKTWVDKLIKVEAMIEQKKLEQNKYEEEINDIRKEFEEINLQEYTIDDELNELDQQINKQKKHFEEVENKRNELRNKLESHQNVKKEILGNTLILKPYKKSLLIIRNGEYKIAFLLHKFRKNLNFEGNLGLCSFNYIISLINNKYELKSTGENEGGYLQRELISIFNCYLNETEFLFILYYSKPTQSLNFLGELIKEICLKGNFEFEIKAIDLNNQIIDNYVPLSTDDINKGFIFEIKKDNKTKMLLVNTDIDFNESRIINGTLNEMAQKKRKAGSKINQTFLNPTNSIILNELQRVKIVVPFHCLNIYDANPFTLEDYCNFDGEMN